MASLPWSPRLLLPIPVYASARLCEGAALTPVSDYLRKLRGLGPPLLDWFRNHNPGNTSRR